MNMNEKMKEVADRMSSQLSNKQKKTFGLLAEILAEETSRVMGRVRESSLASVQQGDPESAVMGAFSSGVSVAVLSFFRLSREEPALFADLAQVPEEGSVDQDQPVPQASPALPASMAW